MKSELLVIAKKINDTLKLPTIAPAVNLDILNNLQNLKITKDTDKHTLSCGISALQTKFHTQSGIELGNLGTGISTKDCSTLRKIHYYLLLKVCELYLNGKGDTDSNNSADLSDQNPEDFNSAWEQQNYGLALIYWAKLSLAERKTFLINFAAISPDDFKRHEHVTAVIIPLLVSMPDLTLDNYTLENNSQGLLELSSNKPVLFNTLLNLDYIDANIKIENEPLLPWWFRHFHEQSGRNLRGNDIEKIFSRHPELLEQMENELTAEHWQLLENGRGIYTFAGFIALNLNQKVFDNFKIEESEGVDIATKATADGAGGMTIVELMFFNNIFRYVDFFYAEHDSYQKFTEQVYSDAIYKKYDSYSFKLFKFQICDILNLREDDERVKDIIEYYRKNEFSFCEDSFKRKKIEAFGFAGVYQILIFDQLRVLLENYNEDLNSLEFKIKNPPLFRTNTLNGIMIDTCIALLFSSSDIIKYAERFILFKMTIVWMHEKFPDVFDLLCKHPQFDPYKTISKHGSDTLISLLIKNGEIATLKAIPQYKLSNICFGKLTSLQYAVREANSRVLKELSKDVIVQEQIYVLSSDYPTLDKYLSCKYTFESPENLKVDYRGISVELYDLLELQLTVGMLSPAMKEIFDVEMIFNAVYFRGTEHKADFFIKNDRITSKVQNSLVVKIVEAAEKALHPEFPERPVSGSFCGGFYDRSSDPKFIDNKTYGWPLIDALRTLRGKIDQAESNHTIRQYNFLREAMSIVNKHIGSSLFSYNRTILTVDNSVPYRARFAEELSKLMLQENCLLRFNLPGGEMMDDSKDYESYVKGVNETFNAFVNISYLCNDNAIDYSPEEYSWLPKLSWS